MGDRGRELKSLPNLVSVLAVLDLRFLFQRVIFLIGIVGAWNPNWVHSARRPLIGLLYLPRVIVRMDNFVELRSAGETEVRMKSAPAPLCPLQIPLD
jgi:hypothetical protein